MTRSGIGPTLEALPVPSSQLDRYRLRLRQRDRGTVAGAHLIRQRGQSLEFREFRPYLPGDDIRHVDWRASARHRPGELVVRTFEHEVQTRVVISIDARETMRLPDVAPKLQLARWFAEAMAYIAGRSGDSVALHALEGGRAIELGSSADRWRIRRALERICRPKARTATVYGSPGRAQRARDPSTGSGSPRATSRGDGMDTLRTMTSVLGHYDPDAADNSPQANYRKAVRLTGQLASLVATYGRLQAGGGPIQPDPALGHAANFLYMLTGARPVYMVPTRNRGIVEAPHECHRSADALVRAEHLNQTRGRGRPRSIPVVVHGPNSRQNLGGVRFP